ncbi:hypothetical protein [Amycolatopsis sp. NPDC051903]|uniref:hypothetical protein n=1 Tax=Amycolatopsis sp. NPDC051903 TaxID=3363936 RepID=UPI00379EB7F1
MDPTIAALITQGLAQPSGANDTGLYTGVVKSWDDLTGSNAVEVNGVVLSNLRVIQTGIGTSYQVNDSVMVERKGTQYFIMGKITAPGSTFSNQIVSAEVDVDENCTSTSYADLATFGPQATVNIGSSRRALVLLSASFSVLSPAGNTTYAGGRMSFQVSGASSIAPNYNIFGAVVGAGAVIFSSRALLLTAADGLQSGQNVFTAKYLRYNTSFTPIIGSRNITVIPF